MSGNSPSLHFGSAIRSAFSPEAEVAAGSTSGFKNLPTNSALSDVATALDQAIGTALRKAGLPVRDEKFTTPEPPQNQSDLSQDTVGLLVHIFNTPEFDGRAAGVMAAALRLRENILQYHLDCLEQAGPAKATSMYEDDVYWDLTPSGRKYVMARRLA
jgi:hypothetical protein